MVPLAPPSPVHRKDQPLPAKTAADTALLEGLIAEAARRGKTDLSLVSVDSTTARAHPDAAGMLVGKDVMEALDEAAAAQGQARQEGARRRNETGGRRKRA
ncbi:hypothetical protein AB0J28_15230 [Streptosporangium canum]